MNIFALLVNPPNKRTIYSVGIRIIICILHRLSNHIQLAEKWKLWNYMTYVRFRNAFYYALCLTSLFILFAGLYLYMLVVQTFSGDDIKFKMYAFIGWGMCSDVLSFSLTFWRLAIYSIYSPLWTWISCNILTGIMLYISFPFVSSNRSYLCWWCIWTIFFLKKTWRKIRRGVDSSEP